MLWNRSNTIALADPHCKSCSGAGLHDVTERYDAPVRMTRKTFYMRRTRVIGARPCGCVLRGVFRECFARWRECSVVGASAMHVEYERGSTVDGILTAGFRDSEYVADFEAIARRTLRPVEYQVFRAYFLSGLNWRAALPRVNHVLQLPAPLNRGTFFHAVYRAEQQLGTAYADAGLYPVPRYFSRQLVQPAVRVGGRWCPPGHRQPIPLAEMP